jgi:adenosylcobinamide-phosphate synthase
MAGALQVALGGDNTYSGELIRAERMGDEFPAPALPKAIEAIRLVSAASLLGLAAGVMFATLVQIKRRAI